AGSSAQAVGRADGPKSEDFRRLDERLCNDHRIPRMDRRRDREPRGEKTMPSRVRPARTVRILTPALAAAAALVSAAVGPVRAQDAVVFRDVRVFDGTKFLPATTVVIRGDRIDQVGPSVPIPDGAKVVDGKGRTLLPGLFDCHTHTFSPEHLRQAAV